MLRFRCNFVFLLWLNVILLIIKVDGRNYNADGGRYASRYETDVDYPFDKLVVDANIDEKEKNMFEDRNDDTLQLAHVIFRHGDRTPDVTTLYPNDPYINETYFPYGLGQLLPAGRDRSYRLGKELRARYNNFIGPIYFPDLLEARSSSYPRTQMTLQLVLSGLFPPTNDFKIGSLNWQPIPYNFVERSRDDLIATYVMCEKIFDMAEELEATPYYKKKLKPLNSLYEYLSIHSGWNVNNTRLLFFIQNSIKCETEWGFPMPDWATKLPWKKFEAAAAKFWVVLSDTPRFRQILIGNLLKKIINNSKDKIERTLKPSARKLYLYAGHDFNIFPMLRALGYNEEKLTPYNAYIAIELHKVNGIYGIKAFYQDYEKRQPKAIKFPKCGTFCPFEEFVNLVDENIAGDDWC